MSLITGNKTDMIIYLAGSNDETTVYDLSVHKEKRSLTQNAYYWVLLSKIADKMKLNKNRVHNQMLRDYGQRIVIDGKPCFVVLPDTEEAENTALDAITFHLKPTSQTKQGKDGKTYRTYVMLKGSSEYNVEEMISLLDGCIQEAKQLDIEVMTPNELNHMRELERQAENAKKQKNKSL